MPDLEEKRTLGYLCPQCGQSVVAQRSLFAMAASATRIPCPCGGSALEIEMEPRRTRLRVPCPFCRREHEVSCPTSGFVGGKTLAFSCAASALTCCCIGEERAVYAAVARMEQAADRLERERDQEAPTAFLNEPVMHEVLAELKEIAGRGAISCTCGSREWDFRVNYSSVDLLCRICGGCLRLPAATSDDLDDLCCRTELVIRGKETKDER